MILPFRALCLLLVAFRFSCWAEDISKPDVFLITIDTLRADHVHCYGYDVLETPAIDSLAHDGIRFSRAFTPSPVTNSSHASIFTGLLPSTHRVTDFGVPLSPLYPTIAEFLQKDDYRTAAFIGAVILDSKTLALGFDHGFEFYDNFPAKTSDKSRWGRLERRGVEVASRAEAWLASHPAGPHFLWLHLYDPHDPYQPPPPYSEIYKDRLYDGEIAYADSALGHFLAFLKARKRYRNSLIVLVGDHGEGLGEHHEDTHGIFLYDSTTHVPLILKLPNEANSGMVVDALVRTTDILPTVLDLLNTSVSRRLDGESLRPYFDGGETAGRTAYGETDYPLSFGWAPLQSLRTSTSLFIEAPRPELYNLVADPAELVNQYEPWNKDVIVFRQELAKLRAAAPVPSSRNAVSPNTVAELRALGYLGSADAGSSTDVPELSFLPDPKDKIEAQNVLHASMVAIEDGHASQARQILKKWLLQDPDFFVGLRQLGELDLQAGDFREAADHLKRASKLKPEDATAALLLGQVLEKQNDLTGARDALQSSLKLQAGQFDAHLLLGQIYLRLKETSAAEDQFAAALLIQPNNSQALLWMAKAKASSPATGQHRK
jgi:choline-sulfatase